MKKTMLYVWSTVFRQKYGFQTSTISDSRIYNQNLFWLDILLSKIVEYLKTIFMSENYA